MIIYVVIVSCLCLDVIKSIPLLLRARDTTLNNYCSKNLISYTVDVFSTSALLLICLLYSYTFILLFPLLLVSTFHFTTNNNIPIFFKMKVSIITNSQFSLVYLSKTEATLIFHIYINVFPCLYANVHIFMLFSGLFCVP